MSCVWSPPRQERDRHMQDIHGVRKGRAKRSGAITNWETITVEGKSPQQELCTLLMCICKYTLSLTGGVKQEKLRSKLKTFTVYNLCNQSREEKLKLGTFTTCIFRIAEPNCNAPCLFVDVTRLTSIS